MVIVLRRLPSVEDVLEELARLPVVEACRPASCPLCGQPAFEPGKPMGIVGHGSYARQVLGLAALGGPSCLLCRVRRYFCRGHAGTISTPPDAIHPKRWYAGGAILEALRLHLVDGRPEPWVRKTFEVTIEPWSNWRSLRRWRRQLLWPIFGWLAVQLGAREEARERAEGRRRLVRLLALAGPSPAVAGFGRAGGANSGFAAARQLLGNTVHDQGQTWPAGHDPPEAIIVKPRRQ